MPAIEPLCHLVGMNPSKLSKEENLLLDADLYLRVCQELKEVFRQQHKDYFHSLKFTLSMENAMLDENFIRLIINDILSTNEYNLQGIAYYTDTPEDVLEELASGINTKPLASCLRKTIELHRSVRQDLYLAIGKKIAYDYLTLLSAKNLALHKKQPSIKDHDAPHAER